MRRGRKRYGGCSLQSLNRRKGASQKLKQGNGSHLPQKQVKGKTSNAGKGRKKGKKKGEQVRRPQDWSKPEGPKVGACL